MNTDALLTLTQWLSPGFPVGAYAYSHGLEAVIDQGALSDAISLENWLLDVLNHGSAGNDLILLAAGYNATGQNLIDVDAIARAFASSAERLTETLDQGAAFVRTVNGIWQTQMPPLCYPVAVGHAAKLRDLPLDTTAQLYAHAMMANLVSAAVRLVPLGQTEGQSVLTRLAPYVQTCAAKALAQDVNDLSSACFALDIAAMQHETQYSKVFRT